MIEAAHDGEADGEAGGPAGEDHGEGGRGVVSVLAVEDGRGHREEPVHGDGHQVEDGRGGAHHVHRKVEITNRIWEVPFAPVGLKIRIFTTQCQEGISLDSSVRFDICKYYSQA